MENLFKMLVNRKLWVCWAVLVLALNFLACKSETAQTPEIQATPTTKTLPKYPDQSDQVVGIWDLSKFDLYIDGKNKAQEFRIGQFDSLLGFHAQRIEYFYNKTFSSKYFDANGEMISYQDGTWSVTQRNLSIEVIKPAPEKWVSSFVIKDNQLFTKTFVDFDGDGAVDDLMVTQADRQKPGQ
ncbi:MAG: hypothetical protein AAFV80_21075 [Bacteroidota bacterium]